MSYSPPAPLAGKITEQNTTQQEVSTEVTPITINSRRLVCENTVYSVFFDHISDVQGREVLNYLSVSPKCQIKNMLTGVSVLPVKDDQFGLIQVFRHPMARWSWEAPKGFIDFDESPERAALRELYEETGFELSAAKLHKLGHTTPEAGLIIGRIGLYAATIDANSVSDSVTHELGHGKLEFFNHDQIAKLITSGQIEDACTLSLLFLYFIQQQNWLVSGKLNGTRENI